MHSGMYSGTHAHRTASLVRTRLWLAAKAHEQRQDKTGQVGPSPLLAPIEGRQAAAQPSVRKPSARLPVSPPHFIRLPPSRPDLQIPGSCINSHSILIKCFKWFLSMVKRR